MNALIACESSGVVREAFRALGINAWSCDLLPADDGSFYHLQRDVREVLVGCRAPDHGFIEWDLMVAHPTCTRLANSGVRWLHVPPKDKTVEQMWAELDAGAAFYRELRDAPIPSKAIENPVMHGYAVERIGMGKRQVVQPHWFGDTAFKATGFELINLPPLVRTHHMALPEKGTDEHKRWSAVHRASPGPDRWKERSRSFPGMARQMAAQWGQLQRQEAA